MMDQNMRYLTISRLGKWLISFLTLSVMIVLATSYILVRDVTALNTSWVNNERSIVQKQAYLSALRGSIGYGGMIHYFKNYLIRHDGKYLLNTHRSILETKILLSGYSVLGVSAEEKAALSNIKEVLQQYTSATVLAERLIYAGASISQTDKQVVVDDTIALNALLSLNDAVAALRQAKTEVVSENINSLSSTIRNAAIWIGAMLVILILLLMWFLRYRLTYPLAKLTESIGKIDPRSPGQTRLTDAGGKTDELALVTIAVNQFLDSMNTHLIERQNAEKSLEIARAAADKANLAKSDFLSSMSHELRTPLNAILGFAQLMQFNPKSPLTDDQKDSTDHIIKGGNHLLELINQILELAKIEAGKMTVSIEPVAVCDAINESVDMVRTLAEKRNISINLDAGDCGNVEVMADLTRFKQVLLNLLSNAIKYNSEGGSVTITAEAKDGNSMLVAVKDTGPGIPKNKQAGIFQPFNRLGHEASEIEGTGIGLVVTRELMHLMNGEICFESEVGKGSTFWIDIPLAKQANAAKSKAVQAVDNIPEMTTAVGTDDCKHTVLYVEDNPANLRLMERIFARMSGVELISAHNAELGLEMAKAEKPSLILLDINLPGMDGYEALKRLRTNDDTRQIPVIAVTAQATESEITRGRQAGFRNYITKPIQVPELTITIKKILESASGAA